MELVDWLKLLGERASEVADVAHLVLAAALLVAAAAREIWAAVR